MSAPNRKKVREMLRVIDRTHRRPVIIVHRANRVERKEEYAEQNGISYTKEEEKMENERNEREAYIEFITRMLKEHADLRTVKIVYEFVLHMIG